VPFTVAEKARQRGGRKETERQKKSDSDACSFFSAAAHEKGRKRSFFGFSHLSQPERRAKTVRLYRVCVFSPAGEAQEKSFHADG
jgi:hypothetical protein